QSWPLQFRQYFDRHFSKIVLSRPSEIQSRPKSLANDIYSAISTQLPPAQQRLEKARRILKVIEGTVLTSDKALSAANCGSEADTRVDGRVSITMAGLLVAQIEVHLLLAAQAAHDRTLLSLTVRCTKSAFASYASANTIDVIRSVQGIAKRAPHLERFIDVDC